MRTKGFTVPMVSRHFQYLNLPYVGYYCTLCKRICGTVQITALSKGTIGATEQ